MTTSSGNKHIKNYIKGRDINYNDDELNDSVMFLVFNFTRVLSVMYILITPKIYMYRIFSPIGYKSFN